MINKLAPTALLIPAVNLPIDATTENLELRLLPYWCGVKHFRTNLLFKYHSPQDYYWHILRHNQNPTIVDGKVVGFHTRSDMYLSRLPHSLQHKIWLNFGAANNDTYHQPKSSNHLN